MSIKAYSPSTSSNAERYFDPDAVHSAMRPISIVDSVGLLAAKGSRTASRAREPFTFLLAGGLTLQLGLYAIANLAVAAGLAPTTGLPLPFVSYGGSALLANLAAAGLLYRISVLNGSSEALTRQRWSREGA